MFCNASELKWVFWFAYGNVHFAYCKVCATRWWLKNTRFKRHLKSMRCKLWSTLSMLLYVSINWYVVNFNVKTGCCNENTEKCFIQNMCCKVYVTKCNLKNAWLNESMAKSKLQTVCCKPNDKWFGWILFEKLINFELYPDFYEKNNHYL